MYTPDGNTATRHRRPGLSHPLVLAGVKFGKFPRPRRLGSPDARKISWRGRPRLRPISSENTRVPKNAEGYSSLCSFQRCSRELALWSSQRNGLTLRSGSPRTYGSIRRQSLIYKFQQPRTFRTLAAWPKGLGLTRQATSPGFAPLVTVRRLVIQGGYTDFIFRPGYVARVTLEGFHLRVPPRGSTANAASTRNDTSKSNTRIGKVIADGAVVEIARREGREPLRFLIHSLTLGSVSRTGRMSYQVALLNPLPAGEIRSSVHFGPWNSDHPGQTPRIRNLRL